MIHEGLMTTSVFMFSFQCKKISQNEFLVKHLNFLKTRFINLTKYSAHPQTDGDIW